MKYQKTVILKDGMECCLRNGTENDAQDVLDNFNLTHAQTDYLASYPDENNSLDAEQERRFLKARAESKNEVYIVALVNDKVVGTAGMEAVGDKYKVRHRTELGIAVEKEFWGLGIGWARIDACIECAKAAGYVQMELGVVADNKRAVSMYEKAGFVEYGRNPKGFCSRISGYQEMVYMRLEL